MAASGWWRVVPFGLSIGLAGVAVASCGEDVRAPVAPEVDAGDAGVADTRDAADAPGDFPLLKPVVIQDKQNHPLGIALDSQFVYWINNKDGSVRKLARDAKPLTEAATLVSGMASPERLAVDGTHVYFTSLSVDASKVVRAPLTGGGTFDVFALGERDPRDILVDATHVYWTNNRDRVVRRQLKASGAAETVFDVASADGEPWGIAQFADKLYVTTYAVGGNIYEHPKTPSFVPDAGDAGASDAATDAASDASGAGGKRAIAIAQDTALAVAVDAANVYWTVKNTGFVLQIPRTGSGSPLVLADKQSAPLGIAIDDKYVYWCTNGGEGQLRRVKIGGDPAGSTVLAEKQTACSYVVTDGNFVYWTTEGPGTTFFQGSVMAMRLK